MLERFCAIHHIKHCCDRFLPSSNTTLTTPNTQGGAHRQRGSGKVQRLVINYIFDLKVITCFCVEFYIDSVLEKEKLSLTFHTAEKCIEFLQLARPIR
jgi:hypothetical protein